MVIVLSSHSPLSGPVRERSSADKGTVVIDEDLSFYLSGKMADDIRKKIDFHKPDNIINLVEYASLDEAEYWRETAYQVNSFAAGRIAEAAAERGVLYAGISTSFVFDGRGGRPYTEEDITSPLTVFGDSKLLGEKMIQESGARSIVLRVPDYYGPGKPLSSISFVRSFFEAGRIEVVKGTRAVPTNMHDIADALFSLVEKDVDGIFHFNQSGTTTGINFVHRACEKGIAAGRLSSMPAIEEVDYREMVLPAERQMNSLLSLKKYLSVTGRDVRGWEDALDESIEKEGAAFF